MEFFLIYMYFFLTNLSGIIKIIAVIGGIIIGFWAFAFLVFSEEITEDEYKRIWNCIPKKTIVMFYIVTILLYTAIPSKEQIAYIIGGGVVWKMGHNEQVQKLPSNVSAAANRFLESINNKQESNQKKNNQ